jgi:predicted N-acetyltransferase YhbS
MNVEAQARIRLREMTAEDIPAGRALSREQNWPHRTSDWTYLFERGSGVVAERDGEVVGTGLRWRYGETAARLGMIIVGAGSQGEGIGSRLMETLLEPLGDRTVILNSTDEGMPLYRKFGFTPVGTICQHQGTAFNVPLPDLRPDERVRPMGRTDREALIELDARAAGMDRRALIDSLLDQSKGVVLDRNNEACGFALFRRFGRGHAVGPTIAPDLNGAKTLISHWLGAKVGMFCRLDVSAEDGLSGWLDELGLPCVGRVTTMVRGKPIEPPSDLRVYSLVSQALG